MQNIQLLVEKQISSFFELGSDDTKRISSSIEQAYKRSCACFQKINNKYYSSFNSLHSGQWCSFLYFLSNEIFKNHGSNETSDKIYYLNKTMNSIDLYYQVELPEVFFWEHPVGTVLGKGSYSNNFVVYQNCTIGSSWDHNGTLHYPKLGENVTMFSYSCILGKCNIGKNTIISSHAYIINTDIPDNSIVFGQGKDLIIKRNNKPSIEFFKKA